MKSSCGRWEELGYSYSDVVKTVDYLVPSALPTYRETAGVRRHFFGERFPVSTGVIVNRLLRPQALVEIDMVAVKGEREVINPGWSRYDRYTYVPGIKVNDLVFMSGFGNLDPSRNDLRGDDDLPTQTERCYSQVAAVVEAAGGSLDDVVKVVEYLTPAAIAEIDNLLPARRGFLKDNSYALTQTVVHSLLIPQMLIEVEAVAVLG